MNEIKTLKVGILGFGTVGQGTWKHLLENENAWEKILGVRLIPSRASVRDLSKKRILQIVIFTLLQSLHQLIKIKPLTFPH